MDVENIFIEEAENCLYYRKIGSVSFPEKEKHPFSYKLNNELKDKYSVNTIHKEDSICFDEIRKIKKSEHKIKQEILNVIEKHNIKNPKIIKICYEYINQYHDMLSFIRESLTFLIIDDNNDGHELKINFCFNGFSKPGTFERDNIGFIKQKNIFDGIKGLLGIARLKALEDFLESPKQYYKKTCGKDYSLQNKITILKDLLFYIKMNILKGHMCLVYNELYGVVWMLIKNLEYIKEKEIPFSYIVALLNQKKKPNVSFIKRIMFKKREKAENFNLFYENILYEYAFGDTSMTSIPSHIITKVLELKEDPLFKISREPSAVICTLRPIDASKISYEDCNYACVHYLLDFEDIDVYLQKNSISISKLTSIKSCKKAQKIFIDKKRFNSNHTVFKHKPYLGELEYVAESLFLEVLKKVQLEILELS